MLSYLLDLRVIIPVFLGAAGFAWYWIAKRWRARQQQILPGQADPQGGQLVVAPLAPMPPGQIERHLRQFYGQIRQTTEDAVPRGPVGIPLAAPPMIAQGEPFPELPLPIPIEMVEGEQTPRKQTLKILVSMLRMMEGTDEKVVRDFYRAIDNARDRVTESALHRFNEMTDQQMLWLLTEGYKNELRGELGRLMVGQITHMQQFHQPTPLERSLAVDPGVQERYPRLPRYLKWLFSHHPELERDPQIRDLLILVAQKLQMATPPIPANLQEYAQESFMKSLYLNPEIAVRVLRSLGFAYEDIQPQPEVVQRTLEDELRVRGALPALPGHPGAEPPPGQEARTGTGVSIEDQQRALHEEIERLKAQRDRYQEDLERLQRQRQTMESSIADLQTRRDALTTEATRIRAEVDEAKASLPKLTDLLRSTRFILEKVRQAVSSTESQRRQVEGAAAGAPGQVVPEAAGAKQEQLQLEAFQREMEETFIQLTSQKKTLDESIRNLETRKASLQEEVGNLQKQDKDLSDRVARLRASATQAEQDAIQAQSRLNSLRTALARTQTELQEKEQGGRPDLDLGTLRAENQRLREEVARAQQQLDTARTQEAEFRRQAVAAESVARQSQEESSKKLKEAEAKLQEAGKATADLRERQAQAQVLLQDLELQRGRLTGELASLRRSLSAEEEAVRRSRQERLRELEQALSVVETSIADTERQTRELEDSLQELQASWKEAHDRKETVVERQLAPAIKRTEDKLKEARKTLAELTERRNRYQSDLKSLQSAGLEEGEEKKGFWKSIRNWWNAPPMEVPGEFQLPYRKARARLVKLGWGEKAEWVTYTYGWSVDKAAVPWTGAAIGLLAGVYLLGVISGGYPEWYNHVWSWKDANTGEMHHFPVKYLLWPLGVLGMPALGALLAVPITYAIIQPIVNLVRLSRKRSQFPDTYRLLMEVINTKENITPESFQATARAFSRMDEALLEPVFTYWLGAGQLWKMRRLASEAEAAKIQIPAFSYYAARVAVLRHLGLFNEENRQIRPELAGKARAVDETIEQTRAWLAENKVRNPQQILAETLPALAEHLRGVENPDSIPEQDIRNRARAIWERKGKPAQSEQVQRADWALAASELRSEVSGRLADNFIAVLSYSREPNPEVKLPVWQGGSPVVGQFLLDVAVDRQRHIHKQKLGQEFDQGYEHLWNFLGNSKMAFHQRFRILRELVSKAAAASSTGREFREWIEFLARRVPANQWVTESHSYSYSHGYRHTAPPQPWIPPIVQTFEQFLEARQGAHQAFDRLARRGSTDRTRLEEAFGGFQNRLQGVEWTKEVEILKATVSEVVMPSRSVQECCARLGNLATAPDEMWRSDKGQIVKFFHDTVAYEQAVESALREAKVPASRAQEALGAIHRLADRVGRQGANPLVVLKEVLPAVARSAQEPGQFLTWLGRLEAFPEQVWKGGAKAVLQKFDTWLGLAHAKDQVAAALGRSPQQREAIAQEIDAAYQRLQQRYPEVATAFREALRAIQSATSSWEGFRSHLQILASFEDGSWNTTESVLRAYADYREYVEAKGEIADRIGRTPPERTAVEKGIARLEQGIDPRRLDSYTLRRGVMQRLATLVEKPETFIFWAEGLGSLGPGLFEVVARDFDVVLERWQEQPHRDWARFCEACVRYRETYHESPAMTPQVVGTFTDPSLSLEERAQKAREQLVGQKLVKLGAPTHLVNLRDPVHPDDLIKVSGGESVVRERLKVSQVKATMAKMGQDGLFSYYESAQPRFYRDFWSELSGFPKDFRQPGEKFRVAYDARAPTVGIVPGDFLPISDPVETVVALLTDLERRFFKLYDNFLSPKRDLLLIDKKKPELGYKAPSEWVTADSVALLARRLLEHFPSWSAIPQDERARAMAELIQVLGGDRLAPLRMRVLAQTENFVRWRLAAQYWAEVKGELKKYATEEAKKKQPKGPVPGSEAYTAILDQINQRLARTAAEVGAGREGLLQFYLSGGTFVDYFRGYCSADCTKDDSVGNKFTETAAWTADPAFLLFKIMENGRWVGNVYSAIFRDSQGQTFLFVDSVVLTTNHSLVTSGRDQQRQSFIEGFMDSLSSHLGEAGFDYVVFANDPSSRDKIRDLVRSELGRRGGASATVQAHKVGGLGHLSEFGFSTEYIQGTGYLSASMSISGTKLAIARTGQELKRRQQELQELVDSIVRMEQHQKRLESRLVPLKAELQQLHGAYDRALTSTYYIVAGELRNPLDQKKVEVDKLERELKDTQSIISARKEQEKQLTAEIQRLQEKTGWTSTGLWTRIFGRSGLEERQPSLVRNLLAGLGVGTAVLVSPETAQAQGFDRNPLVDGLVLPLVFLGAAALGVYLLWEFLKWLFPPSREEMERSERFNWMDTWRPRMEVYRLPDDLVQQLNAILARIPPKEKFGIPSALRLSLPQPAGIGQNQAIRVLRAVLDSIQKHGTVAAFLQEQPYYQEFKRYATTALGLKEVFDQPGLKRAFTAGESRMELILSSRGPEDLLRGEVSCDCTAMSDPSFYNTVPQFMLDPGLLNLKVVQDGIWVGNLYLLVAEQEGRPALIIDAVQLAPWRPTWPIPLEELADMAVREVVAYAREAGFQAVYMSRFSSNFHRLGEHFARQFPPVPTRISKVGGFEHLRALGLWNPMAYRNQYLETFSPNWNRELGPSVDPNAPRQTLLLRPVWDFKSEPLPEGPASALTSPELPPRQLEKPENETPPQSPQGGLEERVGRSIAPGIRSGLSKWPLRWLAPVALSLMLWFGSPTAAHGQQAAPAEAFNQPKVEYVLPSEGPRAPPVTVDAVQPADQTVLEQKAETQVAVQPTEQVEAEKQVEVQKQVEPEKKAETPQVSLPSHLAFLAPFIGERMTVFDFRWASGPPRELADLQARYRDQGVRVVSVYLTDRPIDGIQSVQGGAVERARMSFHTFWRAFGDYRHFPHQVILDGKGNVTTVTRGQLGPQLEQRVAELNAETQKKAEAARMAQQQAELERLGKEAERLRAQQQELATQHEMLRSEVAPLKKEVERIGQEVKAPTPTVDQAKDLQQQVEKLRGQVRQADQVLKQLDTKRSAVQKDLEKLTEEQTRLSKAEEAKEKAPAAPEFSWPGLHSISSADQMNGYLKDRVTPDWLRNRRPDLIPSLTFQGSAAIGGKVYRGHWGKIVQADLTVVGENPMLVRIGEERWWVPSKTEAHLRMSRRGAWIWGPGIEHLPYTLNDAPHLERYLRQLGDADGKIDGIEVEGKGAMSTGGWVYHSGETHLMVVPRQDPLTLTKGPVTHTIAPQEPLRLVVNESGQGTSRVAPELAEQMEQRAAHQRLQKARQEREAEIEALKGGQEKLALQAKGIAGEIDPLRAAVERLGKEARAVELRAVEEQKRATALREEMRKLEQQRQEEARKLKELESQRQDLDRHVQELQKQKEQVAQEVQKLRQEADELQKRTAEVKEIVSTPWWQRTETHLAAILTGILGFIAGLWYRRRKLLARIEALEARMQAMQPQPAAVQAAAGPPPPDRQVVTPPAPPQVTPAVAVPPVGPPQVAEAPPLSVELERLLERVKDLEARAAESENLRRQLDQGLSRAQEAEQRVRDVEGKIGEVRQELEGRQRDIQETQDARQRAETERDAAQQQLEAARQELEQARRALTEGQAQAAERLAAAEKRAEEAQRQLGDAQAQVQNLTTQLVQRQEQLDNTQRALAQVTTERDGAQAALDNANRQLTSLRQVLASKDNQIQALQQQLAAAQAAVAPAPTQVPPAPPRLVAPPPVVSPATLVAQARATGSGVQATHINPERLMESLMEYLLTPSPTGGEDRMRGRLLEELRQIFGQDLEEPPLLDSSVSPKNLVVEIRPSPGYEGRPPVGFDAHTDVNTLPLTPKPPTVDLVVGRITKQGVDDKAAIAAVMETLRTLQEKGIKHRRIRLFFTAEEEHGPPEDPGFGRGARWIVRNRRDLLGDLEILIPIDGPVEQGHPTAIKWMNPDRISLPIQSAISMAARAVNGGREPIVFTFSMGNETQYKEASIPIAHLRANYEEIHAPTENVRADYLAILADWLVEIVIRLDHPDGLPQPFPSPEAAPSQLVEEARQREEARIARLREEAEAAQAEAEAARRAVEEVREAEEAARAARLAEEEALRRTEEERGKAQAELDALQAQLQRAREEAQRQAEEAERRRLALLAEVETLERRRAEREQELNTLQTRLEEATRNLEAAKAEVVDLEAKRAETGGQLAQMRQEVESAQQELATLRGQRDTLQQEVNQLRTEEGRLRGVVEQAREAVAGIERETEGIGIAVEAERLRQEKILADRLAETRRELTVAELQVRETREQAVQAQVELEQTRQQVEELKRQRELEQPSLVAARSRLERDLAELESRKARLGEELSQAQNQLQEAQDPLQNLQDQVRELEGQRSATVSALVTLEQERTTLRRAVDDLRRERDDLEQAVRRLREAREVVVEVPPEQKELQQMVAVIDRFGELIERDRELASRSAIAIFSDPTLDRPVEMEYVVALPEQHGQPPPPVRWVAYQDGEWLLFERQGDRVVSYPIVGPKRGEHITSTTLYLNEKMAAVQVSESQRPPLLDYLGVRPPVPGAPVVEAGGFILGTGEQFQPLVFRYKGVHPPDRRGGLAIFVHPGDEALRQKGIPIGEPLSNQYEAAKSLLPGSSILLGWHSHPKGPPKLGPYDENAIRLASVERHFELIFSPEGVALYRYRVDDEKGKVEEDLIFSSRTVSGWQQGVKDALSRRLAGLEESAVRKVFQRWGIPVGGAAAVLGVGVAAVSLVVPGPWWIIGSTLAGIGITVLAITAFAKLRFRRQQIPYTFLPYYPAGRVRAPGLAEDLRRPEKREASAQELIRIGGMGAVHALLPLLVDLDPDVRAMAARTLTSIAESRESFPALFIRDFVGLVDDKEPGRKFFKAVFLASVIAREGLANLDGATVLAVKNHVLQHFPEIGDPYHPILTGLRQMNAVTDIQFNRAMEGRWRRTGLPSFQEGDVLVSVMGFPVFKGMDPRAQAVQEANAARNRMPPIAIDVWDDEYDRHGDGYTLAVAQRPGPMGFQQDFLWVLLGSRLPPDYLRNSEVSEKIETGQAAVWTLNGVPYLRPVFQIEGRKVVPVGVGATGDRAFYQDLDSGLMVACCVQFGQAALVYREVFRDVRESISPYQTLLNWVSGEIERTRTQEPWQYRLLFGASGAPPIHRLGGAAFSEQGKRWLAERFGLPFHRLHFLLMLDEIAKLVDLNALTLIREILKEQPIGMASMTAPVSGEPSMSHRRALARAFRQATPVPQERVAPPPFPQGRPPFGGGPPIRGAGLEEGTGQEALVRRQRAIERLAEIGRPAVPALVGALKAQHPIARVGAAEVLLKIGDPRALEPLHEVWQESPGNASITEAMLRTAYLAGQPVAEEGSLLVSPAFLDPMIRALLKVKPVASVELTESAVKAIPALRVTQRQLTIEVDAETVIGTEQGYPQLRGFGFTETLVALARAAEAKGVRSDLKIRLVSTNPLLHEASVRNTLALPSQISDMVEVVDASPYLAEARTVTPALTPGSIRVVLEGHEDLWERADVVVRQPGAGEVVSMPGLLVAALSVAPNFYRSLTDPLKAFVQSNASFIEDQDSARSKALARIILVPIPISILPSSYMEQLQETNRRLRQMV